MADLQAAALPPPPGVEPNFDDPFNRGPIYIIIASVFLALPAFFVGIRLWARVVIQRSPWWDDLACVLALLLQASYIGINIWLCLHGVGKHLWNVRLVDFLRLIPPGRVLADITELSIGSTKLALLLFYYRLFWPNLYTRIGIFIGIAFVVAVYGSLFFLFVFLEVMKTTGANKTIAIVNVLSDFYILFLPITAVLQLQLTRKKKLGLVALFSTGLSVCVLSIFGAVYRFRFAIDGTDFTWGLTDVILINTIECSVGIICACLPLVPAVFGSSTILNNWMLSMRSVRQRFLNSGESHSLRSISHRVKADIEAGSMDKSTLENGEQAVIMNETAAQGLHITHSAVWTEVGTVPGTPLQLYNPASLDQNGQASALYSARVLGNDHSTERISQQNGIAVQKEFRVDSRPM
ncbi:hypothetical protein F4859DRAFT_514990 [Xylaria cf. heliscus]|nr:hypothetical protein F4859DRAFT_514990 [Xylaria cf. heliscus]